MQQKGFVSFIAVALALICTFYLSFNVVTNIYDNRAEEYAAGDKMAEYHYLDSLASEKVYLGYTLKECREKELNLGLDLKGGMNVILEVSVPDIVRSLSGNSKDATFNQAMDLAAERSLTSQKDFVDLFYEAFVELDPNARLSVVFSTFDLKDEVSLQSTNDEVIEVVKARVDAAVSNSFTVLRTRIDRFGVVQPNIQRLENNGRILIELPGVKEPERVRKLLQGSANLEFWETYNLNEIYSGLMEANNVIREIKATEEPAQQQEVAPATEEAIIAENTTVSELDSLTAALDEQIQSEDSLALMQEFVKNNPLFAVLQLSTNNGQVMETPAIGLANARDTATITNYLAMRQVKEVLPRDLAFRWGVKAIDEHNTYFYLYAIKVSNRDGKAPLEGNVITDASSSLSQYQTSFEVDMAMNPEGAKIWSRLTKDNIGRCIAIVLDDMVYSAPRVNQQIDGGRSQITGDFTQEEAKDLANVLKSGKMPAPSHIIQEDIVGPSLGQEAIRDGMISFLVAFVLLMIYMIMMYGVVPGLIVDGALLINVFFLIGILTSFSAVLTMPGIAGIVLTLGMAVDANVLIYERIKEEIANGKTRGSAVEAGYKAALSAIVDSNVTTLLTGIILFLFGTGPIKGFATTLIIGIITSFFTAVFLTHLVYDAIVKSGKIDNMTFTTSISRNLFNHISFDWVKARKVGYVVSLVAITISVLSLIFHGLNQGIDFTGGRNYVVAFQEPVDTEEVLDLLQPSFSGSSLSVITIGNDRQVRISTNYKIADKAKEVDEEVETKIFEALKDKLNSELTREQFVMGYTVDKGNHPSIAVSADQETFGIKSSQKVGAAIADDIKTGAYTAVFFALCVIFLYILIRFRSPAYSTGSVVAVIHDTLLVLGVYSLFYSILPFSLEIDQAFIAAILTVVGYSVNDTVVVFDRVREIHKNYPNRPAAESINDALNATLMRTMSTSVSTLIVLLCIFILGGDTIRGFVLALTVGVLVGTWSTLFVAVPISYDINRMRANRKAKK